MGCLNTFHSLTFYLPLPRPVIPSERLTNTILFSLTVYMYVCVCVFLYTYLTYRSNSHILEKACKL